MIYHYLESLLLPVLPVDTVTTSCSASGYEQQTRVTQWY